ncbi:hypothetical protein [Psychrobacter sp. GP33]|nr:hypothetical protein [Psychrobacter sp. GP33]
MGMSQFYDFSKELTSGADSKGTPIMHDVVADYNKRFIGLDKYQCDNSL